MPKYSVARIPSRGRYQWVCTKNGRVFGQYITGGWSSVSEAIRAALKLNIADGLPKRKSAPAQKHGKKIATRFDIAKAKAKRRPFKVTYQVAELANRFKLGGGGKRRHRKHGLSGNSTACPACSGPGVELGTLGRLRWYRCRNCGMEFSTRFRRRSKRGRTLSGGKSVLKSVRLSGCKRKKSHRKHRRR